MEYEILWLSADSIESYLYICFISVTPQISCQMKVFESTISSTKKLCHGWLLIKINLQRFCDFGLHNTKLYSFVSKRL